MTALAIPLAPWTADAACAGHPDPDLWHPRIGRGTRAAAWAVATAPARDICAGCPVAAECLTHAVGDRRLEGVWGGTTTAERRRIRGRRAGTTFPPAGYVAVPDAAERLGISARAVYRRVRAGTLPVHRVRGRGGRTVTVIPEAAL